MVLVDELVRAERLLVLAQRLLEPAALARLSPSRARNLAVRHRATVRVGREPRRTRASFARRKRPNSRYGRGTSDASRGNVSRRRRARGLNASHPPNAMRGPRRGSAFRVPRRLHPARVAECRAQRRARRIFNAHRRARLPRRAWSLRISSRWTRKRPEPAASRFPDVRAEPPARTRTRPVDRRARRVVVLQFRASSDLRFPPARRERPRPPPARHPRVRPPSSARPVSARHVLGLRAPRTPRACSSPGRPSATPADSCRASTRETPSRTPSSPSTAPAVLPHGDFPPIRPRRRTGRRDTTRTPRARRNPSSPARSPRELPRASHGMRPLRLRPEMVVLRRVLRRVHGVVPRRIPRSRRGGRGERRAPVAAEYASWDGCTPIPEDVAYPRGTAIGTRRTPRTRGRRPRFSLVHRGVRARRADGGGLT